MNKDVKTFRYSPIKNKGELFEAIEYIHFECHRMCKKILGYYLPVSGNIGVFSHYEDEYELLTQIRKELTNIDDNWNQKYFKLHKPIVIPAKSNVPETVYTYLYTRRPEVAHPNVGDVDFYMEPDKYKMIKQDLLSGKKIKGLQIFDRPDLDLIRIHDFNFDVSAFFGTYQMSEIHKQNQEKS